MGNQNPNECTDTYIENWQMLGKQVKSKVSKVIVFLCYLITLLKKRIS